MCEKVIVIWGEDAVNRYFNVRDRSKETVNMLLKHIDIYDFNTEDEAEAFRLGVCAVKSPSAEDFCELTQQGYSSLINIAENGLR
jgi:hypothetical protein